MRERRKRTENSGQKKAPTPEELCRQIWQSIEGNVTVLMKIMFEILRGRAATELLGALPYQRTRSRRSYRDGTY